MHQLVATNRASAPTKDVLADTAASDDALQAKQAAEVALPCAWIQRAALRASRAVGATDAASAQETTVVSLASLGSYGIESLLLSLRKGPAQARVDKQGAGGEGSGQLRATPVPASATSCGTCGAHERTNMNVQT
eukprot:366354-Chlamydomonas_euryale.AAC.3